MKVTTALLDKITTKPQSSSLNAHFPAASSSNWAPAFVWREHQTDPSAHPETLHIHLQRTEAALIKSGAAFAASLRDILNKGARLKLTQTIIIHRAIAAATAAINLGLIDFYYRSRRSRRMKSAALMAPFKPKQLFHLGVKGA